MTLTIYEKPSCTTCKNLFTLLSAHGVDMERIDYHVTGLTEDELRGLLARMGAGPRDVLRTREPLVDELGLPGERSDDELIALMVEHPQLVQRPIVVQGDRAVLARPVERALELLD